MTDSVLDRWLHRPAVWWTSALALAASVTFLSLAGNGGAVVVVAAAAAIVLALASTEDRHGWQTIVALALVGAAIRAVAHAGLVAWTSSAGGPFLGPDSSTYFFRSVILAEDGFRITDSPALHFGTYDAAHYYLFAAIVAVVGPDLVALQAANWSMTILAGPLAWSIARRVAPAHATAVGLLVTVYPSLVAVSVNDLLKDPSVITLSLVGAWVLVRLVTAHDGWPARLALVGVGGGALAYVHMSRFYVAAFLLLAAVTALAVTWLRTRRDPARRPAAAAVLSMVLVFGIGEAVPRAMGWPYSPLMLADQFAHVMNSPGMRLYAPGLLARLSSDGGGSPAASLGDGASTSLPATGPALLDRGDSMSHSAREILAKTRDRGTKPRSTDSPHVAPGTPRPPKPAAGAPPADAAPPAEGPRLVRWGTNGIRKLFGPFPWVPPPDFSPQTITLGDYLLFPGMLVWYAVLPIALAAMFVAAGDMLRGRSGGLSLGIALFSAALFVLYLGLNLSWRQREFMFPFLVLLAFWAIDRVRAQRWARYAYAAYWCGIVLLAVTHTVVRAMVG